MTFRIAGSANSTIAEVETASLALRRAVMGPDLLFRGAYSTGLVFPVVPATVAGAASGIALGFRQLGPNASVWLKRISVSMGHSTIPGAAGVVSWTFNKITGSYSAYTLPGGVLQTIATPTRLRSTFPESLIGINNITVADSSTASSNYAALTQGTRTLLASAAGAAVGSFRATAGYSPLPGLSDLVRYQPGDQALTIQEYEGFELSFVTPSTLQSLGVNLVWEEYTRR